MSGTVTAQRKQLGNELRHAREAAGLTQHEARDIIGCSQAKMTRIEAGTVSIKPKDLRALLEGYGVTDERAETLLELASTTGRRRGQWAGYRKVVPDAFRMFTDLEPAAREIQVWEEARMPGLLQSEYYMLQQFVAAGAEQINSRVRSRLDRQTLLEQPPASAPNPTSSEEGVGEAPYTFVIGETAFFRAPGGRTATPYVMVDQMEHLLHVIDTYEHVAVHVLPLDAEIASTPTDFTIMRFDGTVKDFAYVAHSSGGIYVDDEDDLQYFAEAYAAVHGAVLEREQSRAFIERVVEKYDEQ